MPVGIVYGHGVEADVLFFFERKPGGGKRWTKRLWVYDHRTNIHRTLKTKGMVRADLDDFVTCYRPADRHKRKPTCHETKTSEGRWRAFTCAGRDKFKVDLFLLLDESLQDSADLPDPEVLAQEIAAELRSALAETEEIFGDLEERVMRSGTND